MSFYRETLQKC